MFSKYEKLRKSKSNSSIPTLKCRYHFIHELDKEFNIISIIKRTNSNNATDSININTIENSNKILNCDENDTDSSSDTDFLPPSPKQIKKIPDTADRPKIIPKITRNIAAALDRAELSGNKAALVVSAVLDAAGCNLNEISVSKETIRKEREKNRELTNREVRAEFKFGSFLTVHWDGKMLPDLTFEGDSNSDVQVDRLAIVATGDGKSKLLGVPKISSGTGLSQANAVFGAAKDWKIEENVKAICFDTTSSNTGVKSGACVLLEQKFGKPLFWFACRHHIYELTVSIAYTTALKEVSSGPTIVLFEKFRRQWTNINKNSFESGVANPNVSHLITESKKNEIISFAKKQLDVIGSKDRKDYSEVLELTLLFFG